MSLFKLETLAAVALAACALAEATPGNALDVKTVRAIVFKDGYTMFVKEAKGAIGSNHEAVIEDIPESMVLGSFWPVPEKGKLVGVVAIQEPAAEAPLIGRERGPARVFQVQLRVQGQQGHRREHLHQRRMLAVEAVVPRGQVGVARRQMGHLVGGAALAGHAVDRERGEQGQQDRGGDADVKRFRRRGLGGGGHPTMVGRALRAGQGPGILQRNKSVDGLCDRT